VDTRFRRLFSQTMSNLIGYSMLPLDCWRSWEVPASS